MIKLSQIVAALVLGVTGLATLAQTTTSAGPGSAGATAPSGVQLGQDASKTPAEVGAAVSSKTGGVPGQSMKKPTHRTLPASKANKPKAEVDSAERTEPAGASAPTGTAGDK